MIIYYTKLPVFAYFIYYQVFFFLKHSIMYNQLIVTFNC